MDHPEQSECKNFAEIDLLKSVVPVEDSPRLGDRGYYRVALSSSPRKGRLDHNMVGRLRCSKTHVKTLLGVIADVRFSRPINRGQLDKLSIFNR